MTTRFEPLTNHLVIELEPEPEQSKVIAVQRSTEGLARFGRVLAVGPEVRDVRTGQRVLASITAGVQIGRENTLLISEPAILATAQV